MKDRTLIINGCDPIKIAGNESIIIIGNKLMTKNGPITLPANQPISIRDDNPITVSRNWSISRTRTTTTTGRADWGYCYRCTMTIIYIIALYGLIIVSSSIYHFYGRLYMLDI